MEAEDKQPFMSHLEELRQRLIVCAVAVGAGFVGAYFFSEQLFWLLAQPLKDALPEGEKLIFTNLPEMFFTYLKVSFVTGLMAAMPVIFYELWLFVAPGLYPGERRYLLPFVTSSSLLFVGGALFGYFVVFPFGFKFFVGFANDYVQALPSVREYFSFSLKLLLAFGLAFELPVVIFFLSRMGVVTPQILRKKRKYAILLTFIAGAILTPPDVITQVMMAGPLILLYEVSILLSGLAQKKRRAAAEEKADDDTEASPKEG